MTRGGPLLEWYEPRRRAYPWRRRPDPYRVLVSEVMLQQTQAARVAPAFAAFLQRFPTIRALAAVPRAEVLRAWSGLGYNRRAVALSEAARAVVRDHGGSIPRTADELRRLPGVGPYTAAAVASIGHGEPVPAIDTNVGRVVARHRLGCDPSEASRGNVRSAALRWLDRRHPGEWNQALMDLGREVCRPAPRCSACPLASSCRFRRAGRIARSPLRWSSRFDGSFPQLRGAVVRALVARSPRTLGGLARALARPEAEVVSAVAALHRDGVVVAGAAALGGQPTGRVRLAT